MIWVKISVFKLVDCLGTLYIERSVSLSQALKGNIDFVHLDGSRYTIGVMDRDMVLCERKWVVRGLGLHVEGAFGDLVVDVKVKLPERMDRCVKKGILELVESSK